MPTSSSLFSSPFRWFVHFAFFRHAEALQGFIVYSIRRGRSRVVVLTNKTIFSRSAGALLVIQAADVTSWK
jgi:hypothetical protein